MKLGIGLYRHLLTRDNFRFARQAGCTHLVIHLAEYYQEKNILPATDGKVNYGTAAAHDPIWEADSMTALQKMAQEEGLVIYAIENFSPADWYDVLLDGPKKHVQMERCIQIVRNAGQAGIRSFGYNFSLAGVWGHQKLPAARGGAVSACFDASALDLDAPIPDGEVWNMTYAPGGGGYLKDISGDELWARFEWFLSRILPAAEEAGVEMALHPDDPPMPRLRKTPRLVYQPGLYQKMIDMNASPANRIEMCMGSIQEMSEGSVYDALETYLAQDRVSYVHFRNVAGKVPNYREVFVDEGDIDMMKALRIFKKHRFDGVLVPDHTPQMTCDAPWHAGMAFALGYMKLALRMVREEMGE